MTAEFNQLVVDGLDYLRKKRPVMVWDELAYGRGYGFYDPSALAFRAFIHDKNPAKDNCNFESTAFSVVMDEAVRQLGYRKTAVSSETSKGWRVVKWEPTHPL